MQVMRVGASLPVSRVYSKVAYTSTHQAHFSILGLIHHHPKEHAQEILSPPSSLLPLLSSPDYRQEIITTTTCFPIPLRSRLHLAPVSLSVKQHSTAIPPTVTPASLTATLAHKLCFPLTPGGQIRRSRRLFLDSSRWTPGHLFLY